MTDRYFAMASTYPALAFPKISQLGQKHMRKLRRDRPKVASAIERGVQGLYALLGPEPDGGFPAKLGLTEQGLFVLGYYHQKAWAAEQATQRKRTGIETEELSQED